MNNLEEVLKNEIQLQTAIDDLGAWIQADPKSGITEYKGIVVKDAESGRLTADIYTVRYADRMTTLFNLENLQSSEIIELRRIWKEIQSVSTLPLTILEGENEVPFENYTEFYEHVMESTKKGIYIQRYKGLGEMNPVQLWETTLNPENRTLLKVTINDAVAADETFSVLMGELVEPRRQFIHDNALLARSLDV